MGGFIHGSLCGGSLGGAVASVGGPIGRRMGYKMPDFEGKGLIGGAIFGGVIGCVRADNIT